MYIYVGNYYYIIIYIIIITYSIKKRRKHTFLSSHPLHTRLRRPARIKWSWRVGVYRCPRERLSIVWYPDISPSTIILHRHSNDHASSSSLSSSITNSRAQRLTKLYRHRQETFSSIRYTRYIKHFDISLTLWQDFHVTIITTYHEAWN